MIVTANQVSYNHDLETGVSNLYTKESCFASKYMQHWKGKSIGRYDCAK